MADMNGWQWALVIALSSWGLGNVILTLVLLYLHRKEQRHGRTD